MAVYEIQTDNGTYQVETEDAPQQAPAAVQQAQAYAQSGGKGAPPAVPSHLPWALQKQDYDNSPVQGAPILPSGMALPAVAGAAVHALGGALGLNLADQAAQKGGKVLGGPILPRPSGLLATEGAEVPTIGQQITGAVKDVFPTKARAGLLYDQVGKAVADTPVDLSKARQTVLEMKEMAADGGSGLPRVARAVLKKTEDSTNVPWENARRMASNSGRLSAGEMMNLNPPMRAKVAQLAKDLSEANKAAAEKAGVGQQYQTAMTGYRNAARLESLKGAVKDVAKNKAIQAGAGAGLASTGLLGVAKKLGLL